MLFAASCEYLIVSNNTWSTAGCKVYSQNASHIVCHCTHLTDFVAMLRSSLVPLEEAGYARTHLAFYIPLNSIFFSTNINNAGLILPGLLKRPAAIIFIVIIFVLYFVVLGVALYYDNRRDVSTC